MTYAYTEAGGSTFFHIAGIYLPDYSLCQPNAITFQLCILYIKIVLPG